MKKIIVFASGICWLMFASLMFASSEDRGLVGQGFDVSDFALIALTNPLSAESIELESAHPGDINKSYDIAVADYAPLNQVPSTRPAKERLQTRSIYLARSPALLRLYMKPDADEAWSS